MTTLDILLLKTLDEFNAATTIKEVKEKLKLLKLKPSPATVYRRLEFMSCQQFVINDWKKGAKVYLISEDGKTALNIFKSQLRA